MPKTKKINISWKKYYKYIHSLEKLIKKDIDNGKINQILCLARGGLILGDALSRKFKLPLAIMFTSSYTKQTKGELIIGDAIAKQYNTIGNKILIVDDLVDSGETLEKIKNYIAKELNAEVKTAVIWKKTTAPFTPDYYIKKTKPNQWITQPFEK